MSAARTIPTSQSPDLVTYTIVLAGEELPLSVSVKSLEVNKEINKIPSAKMVIADGDSAIEDFLVSNGTQFIPGNEVEIKLGYHGDNKTVFKGIITAHSNKISSAGGSTLNIECKDAAVKMTIGRKNKHYNDLSDGDIAEEIISKYGLEMDVETTPVKHKDLVQFDISDWDFLLTRMDMMGLVCIVDDGKVIFKKPDLSATSVLDVLYGSTIIEYEATADARDQWQSVTALSWDYSQQSTLEVSANEPSIGEEAGDITASTLSDVIGLDEYKLIHSGKLSSEELQAWADAKMQKQRLSKIRGNVKIIGYPDLKPDMYIRLNGVGNRFNGPVYTNSVKHIFNGGAWETEVVFGLSPEWYAEGRIAASSSNMLGMMPTLQGLVTGIVTDLEDPDGEDRVRVKLPVVSNDEEGIWARIASLDAGKERGMFFRPEIGDEVILAAINNDSTQLIILGMMHSSSLPAPLKAANANDEKGYVSREKVKWIFNDSAKSLQIETPGGKKITLSDKDKFIKIEDENSNKITMDSSGITIESASALTLKGGASVKVEGPTVSVEGSATTTIKGGMVNIN